MEHHSTFLTKIEVNFKEMPKWKHNLLKAWFENYTDARVGDLNVLLCDRVSDETKQSIRRLFLRTRTSSYRSSSSPTGRLVMELGGNCAAMGEDYVAFMNLFTEYMPEENVVVLVYKMQGNPKMVYRCNGLKRFELYELKSDDHDYLWDEYVKQFLLNVAN